MGFVLAQGLCSAAKATWTLAFGDLLARSVVAQSERERKRPYHLSFVPSSLNSRTAFSICPTETGGSDLTWEPFENGRGYSLRVLRAGKPRTRFAGSALTDSASVAVSICNRSAPETESPKRNFS